MRNRKLRITDIEQREGIRYAKPNFDSNLVLWYDRVRNKTIEELTIEDLARFVRQEKYLEDILPEVFQSLGDDLWQGEMYRGELFHALTTINEQYWQEHPRMKVLLCQFLNSIVENNYHLINVTQFDEIMVTKEEAMEIIQKLEEICNNSDDLIL